MRSDFNLKTNLRSSSQPWSVVPFHLSQRIELLGDHSPEPFIRAEILKNRKRVCHRLTSSPGFDTTTYKLFLSLTDDALLRFFNMCLDLRSAPRLWMITILIGILKPGKDAKKPASYRLIGLESCLLKMFTLLWDDRFPTDNARLINEHL